MRKLFEPCYLDSSSSSAAFRTPRTAWAWEYKYKCCRSPAGARTLDNRPHSIEHPPSLLKAKSDISIGIVSYQAARVSATLLSLAECTRHLYPGTSSFQQSWHRVDFKAPCWPEALVAARLGSQDVHQAWYEQTLFFFSSFNVPGRRLQALLASSTVQKTEQSVQNRNPVAG
jgi:hypothetical protein